MYKLKIQLHTGLDYIKKGGAERCLLSFQIIEDFSRKVFLEERLGIGFLQFLEAGFQFFQNCSVNHCVCFSVITQKKQKKTN